MKFRGPEGPKSRGPEDLGKTDGARIRVVGEQDHKTRCLFLPD